MLLSWNFKRIYGFTYICHVSVSSCNLIIVLAGFTFSPLKFNSLKNLENYKKLQMFFCGPMPPHVLCGHRGPPSWAWQDCNRLLRLGRPWGAVTLFRWCARGDRGGCSARRGLKPKFYSCTQTMVTAGIFPFKDNSHGRGENRTLDLMISSQKLWPLDHAAGL